MTMDPERATLNYCIRKFKGSPWLEAAVNKRKGEIYENRIKKRTGFLNGCGILQRPGLWSHAGELTRMAFEQIGILIPFLDLDSDRFFGRFHFPILLFATCVHLREEDPARLSFRW